MDPDDFGEIAGNLLDNARKHARATVRVSLNAAGGSPVICFDDDGPGIPPEDRKRIIRRGEQATGEGEGSGLGLSIVIEALAQYRVSLTIDDSPLGGCRMSFPAVGFVQPPPSVRTAAPSVGGSPTSSRPSQPRFKHVQKGQRNGAIKNGQRQNGDEDHGDHLRHPSAG
jgi:hypothetical protein